MAQPPRTPHHSDEHPAVLNPVQARQGLLGRPVLVVLIVSTLLAALVMGWMVLLH